MKFSVAVLALAAIAAVADAVDHRKVSGTNRALNAISLLLKDGDAKLSLESQQQQQHRFLVGVGRSPLEQEAERLTQQKSNTNNINKMDCDGAFLQCLKADPCVNCFLEMQTNEIDWASVTRDTPCQDVLGFLQTQGHCNALANDQTGQQFFCNTFEACVIWDDNNKKDGGDSDDADNKKEDDIDCSKLTECNWPGMHPSFLGDGVCHDNIGGCYNTAICNWDGGDCCEDTCESSSNYVQCGHDGYVCRDPNSTNCDPLFTIDCPKDANATDKKYHVDPSGGDCGVDETLYRLVMYDSFGDGWDDTKITISPTNDRNKQAYQGGLTTGSQGVDYMCLSRSATCYHAEVAGGVWGKEVSWEVKPYWDGSPAIAGGGAPMSCDFAVAGASCSNTCTGKPNIEPNKDPEYKEFKDMYNCIESKCVIQVGACKKDPVCQQCFQAEVSDFCYAVDTFNAVVDCTLCQCTENKNSAFCQQKVTPGSYVPPDKGRGEEPKPRECSPAETLKGGAAVMEFGKCTNFDEVAMMVTDFDQNNFGDLDTFESCAHAFQSKDNHGGHTALGCLQILVNAMNGAMDDENKADSSVPVDAIAALANLLYHDAQSFCDCAQKASDDCPLCPSFVHFKTLLYESLDACQSLDEIDCDAWNEFYKPCMTNINTNFGAVDFSKKEQCEYVHNNCGGAGPFPAFRRLDCGKEIPASAWEFYQRYSGACLKDGGGGSDNQPVTPPAPSPTPPVPAPVAPTPVHPSDNVKPSQSDKTPSYVPPEEKKDAAPSYVPEEGKKKSHWFRNLFFLLIIGGGAYWYYKRRSDGFSFIRYRRMRTNFGGDESMYSGLAMESSTNFEPPSLPATPAAMGDLS